MTAVQQLPLGVGAKRISVCLADPKESEARLARLLRLNGDKLASMFERVKNPRSFSACGQWTHFDNG